MFNVPSSPSCQSSRWRMHIARSGTRLGRSSVDLYVTMGRHVPPQKCLSVGIWTPSDTWQRLVETWADIQQSVVDVQRNATVTTRGNFRQLSFANLRPSSCHGSGTFPANRSQYCTVPMSGSRLISRSSRLSGEYSRSFRLAQNVTSRFPTETIDRR